MSIQKLTETILGVADKYITTDKERMEFEIELRKLQIDSWKAKTGVQKLIHCLFPMVAGLFCLYHLSNLISLWISYITGKEAFNFVVPPEFWDIMKFYLVGFFGQLGIEKYKK